MDETRGATAEARGTSGGIPLALAPLLSPYRRHRHLSLRLERLPERARLSKGSNNGDRTWSLTVDDLEGLTYLPPAGRHEAHMLALRIVNLDGDDGATLAVLDVPVPSGDALAVPAAGAVAILAGEADAGHEIERRRLHDEMARLKASLSAREAELAQARQQLDHARAEASHQAIEAQLAAARTAWEGELGDRLAAAAAEAAASLEQQRAAWQAEQEGHLANIAARAEERIAAARERWQQESQASLSSAQARWQADEAVRLAAAEAQWREDSAPALAESKARVAQAEAALAQARAEVEAAAIALRDLRNELADTKAQLSTRDAEVSETRRKLADALSDGSRQAIETELAAAREAWQAELRDRLAAAGEQAAALLEKSRAAWQAEQAHTLATAEEQRRERAGEAEQRWQAEARASLAKAEAAWQAGEALRLAAAEAQWLEEVAPTLAEAEARRDSAETELAKARAQARGDEVELHFLREELQEVKAALALRETELAEARSMAAPLREGRSLGAGQVPSAERFLAGLIEARREAAVAEAGGAPARALPEHRQSRTGRRFVGVGALVLASATAVMFHSRIEQAIVDGLWSRPLPPSTRSEPPLRTSEPQPSPPAEVAERRAVVGVSDAKLRSGPSTAAAVIAALPRGTEVVPLERRGDWVLVRTGGGERTNQREGWVFRSSLKEG